MDHEHFPGIENNHLIHGSKYLMWSLQLVVSLSVLCLFISYFTGISLYYSYTYYFSTILLPLLTHALELKFAFLFCNGIILIFLVGFRGVLGFDVDYVTLNYDDYVLDPITKSLETLNVGDDQSHEILEYDCLESEDEEEKEKEREEFDGCIVMAEADNDPNEEEEEEEEEEIVVDDEVVSTILSSCTDDELNKKFDEFIRRMKEELRLEAQEYHLIPA